MTKQLYFLNVTDNYEEMPEYGATIQMSDDQRQLSATASEINSSNDVNARNYYGVYEAPIETNLYDEELEAELTFSFDDLIGLTVEGAGTVGVISQVLIGGFVVEDDIQSEFIALEDIERIFKLKEE